MTPSVVHEPLVRMGKGQARASNRRSQRIVDVIGSSTILVLASPLLLGIAALIRIFDPGPVIFRQERKGLGGEAFTMLKFRTMVTRNPMGYFAPRPAALSPIPYSGGRET